jgi:hypothetical protein
LHAKRRGPGLGSCTHPGKSQSASTAHAYFEALLQAAALIAPGALEKVPDGQGTHMV